MPTVVKRSMAGGELAPSLHSRADMAKYLTGLATCRNFVVRRSGGVSTRPGTIHVGPCKYDDKIVRLIPFIFSADQSYVIELGHLYFRVIYRGGYVLDTPINISGLGLGASTTLTTASPHGMATDDTVYVSRALTSSTMGTDEMDGRFCKIVVTGPSTMTLRSPHGSNPIDSTGYTFFSGPGEVARVTEVATPYTHDQLRDITYSQSGDVITLAHQSHALRELTRSGGGVWSMSTPTIGAPVPTLSVSSLVDSTPVDTGYGIKIGVTSVTAAGEESTPVTFPIYRPVDDDDLIASNISLNTAHSFALNVFSSFLEGRTVTVKNDTNVAASSVQFAITGETVTRDVVTEVMSGLPARTGATIATVNKFTKVTSVSNEGLAATVLVDVGVYGTPQWFPKDISIIYVEPTSTFREFRVYRGQLNSTALGLVDYVSGAVASPTKFTIPDVIPDYSITPPRNDDSINGVSANARPAAIGWFQGRLVLASTVDNPETVWLSRIGFPKNFSTSTPTQDDNAIEFTTSGPTVSRIRHIIDIGRLILFTDENEILVEGDISGVITPTSINARKVSYNGIGRLPPIAVGGSALFVQARGRNVRDLGGRVEADSYSGNDLSVFASHLFEESSIVDWAYQKIPESIVWGIMDNGNLVGLTYLSEHDIWGWHRHDTYDRRSIYSSVTSSPAKLTDKTLVQYGAFKSVCSVPASGYDEVYVAVSRTGDEYGVVVERMADRLKQDIADHVCTDASIVYDGTNSDTGAAIWFDAATWGSGDAVFIRLVASPSSTTTIQSPVAIRAGDKVRLTKGSESAYATVNAGLSGTYFITANFDDDVPAALQTASAAAATTDWGVLKNQIYGAHHLYRSDVSVQGDGYIVANPLRDELALVTVADGGIVALGDHYEKVSIGLPIVADVKTLDLDLQESALVDQKKLVTKVTIGMEKTGRLFVGNDDPGGYDSDDPTTDGSLTNLRELTSYSDTGTGGAVDDRIVLADKYEDVQIDPCWNSRGRVFLRNIDPVPATILSIAPSVLTGPRGQR